MGFLLSLWHHIPDFIRLKVYRALIYIGQRLYESTWSPRCHRLPFNMYAKFGNTIESEVIAMQYVKEHTSIPIPTVLDVIQVPEGAFMVMTRVPGEPVRGRLQGISATELSLLASDLKSCFDQLRSLPAPPDGPQIRSIGGGSFLCYRIAWDPVGPFATEQDLYQYLIKRSYLREQEHLEQFGRKVHTTSHRICFTHNDLNPLNILVDSNARLTGIVDWECAAWLPDYWEYTRSCFHRDPYHEWLQCMEDAFGSWPEELNVEREMWKYNDPY